MCLFGLKDDNFNIKVFKEMVNLFCLKDDDGCITRK